jgi:Plasmid pRiA4b ORF-3-like protein
MARRKPDKAGEVERPITADSSAKMLEVYAGMILDLADRSAAQETTGPGWLSRTETIDLTLTPDDRTILLGLPEQVEPLKGRLDIAADGDESIQITLEELAGMLLALSHGISRAEGQGALKMIRVAGKVAPCFSDHLSKQAPVRRRKAAAKEAQPTKGQEAVYQVKITLKDIRPPIWRRVLVTDCSLSKLHEIIQVVMG